MEPKKYRKISTHIWNDEKFRDLSNEAKFIFLFVLTHPTMTSLGALRGNIPGLAFELGMEMEAFQKAFQEVIKKGMLEYDPKCSFLWCPNFLKHNKPESPNVIRSWAGAYRELPECEAKEELKYNARALICCLSEGYQKAFAEAFGEPCEKATANQRTESREQRTEIKREETSHAGDVGDSVGDENIIPAEGKQPEPESQAEDESEKVGGPKMPNCLHAEIAEIYNRCLPELPQVKEITPKRKSALRSLWRASKERQDLSWWENYFNQVSNCPYLLGKKKDWKAGFDWLLKPGNMVKVLEGNYLDRSPAQNNGQNQQNGSSPYAGVKPSSVAQAGLLERDRIARQILAQQNAGNGDMNHAIDV